MIVSVYYRLDDGFLEKKKTKKWRRGNQQVSQVVCSAEAVWLRYIRGDDGVRASRNAERDVPPIMAGSTQTLDFGV